MKKSLLQKDAKRTDNPLTDRVAYKQCVTQMKAQRASNPWTQCSARFGIDKSEGCGCERCDIAKHSIQAGMSFRDLQKKEAKWKSKAELRPDKVNEVAPAVYMKKPRQIPKVFKADTHLKEWKIQSTPEPQDLIETISRPAETENLEDRQTMRAAAIFKFEIQPGMSYAQLKKARAKE